MYAHSKTQISAPEGQTQAHQEHPGLALASALLVHVLLLGFVLLEVDTVMPTHPGQVCQDRHVQRAALAKTSYYFHGETTCRTAARLHKLELGCHSLKLRLIPMQT